MLDITNLAVQAGTRRLLSGLTLHLPAGAILAVLGPNGRGKTSLLKTVLGLRAPAAGTVRLGGPPAYVPQQQDMLFDYDVLTLVTLGRARHLPWYASPGKADFEIAHASLAQVGLAELARRPLRALSGGQQQLAAIARALASESPLLVLDEPAAALDLRNQDIVLTLLHRLSREHGMTVVFSTHQPQHALHIADQTLLMMPGPCEAGATAQMCTEARLSALYGLPLRLASTGGTQGVIPIFSVPQAKP
ncbi:ABC transporter ATP-binding protein [Bordetella trematum]|uniref:ABC transporter ATP-binding protein n=1 Tax=Bordetella trematum TaxID=123899 RepID=UPI003988B2F1